MNKKIISYLPVLLLLLATSDVYAANDSPMGEILCTVSGWFTGNLGKGLATLCIATFGVRQLFIGRVKGRSNTLRIAAGIALVFGAASVVSSLGGGIAGC